LIEEYVMNYSSTIFDISAALAGSFLFSD
jgi:hypothetical protein